MTQVASTLFESGIYRGGNGLGRSCLWLRLALFSSKQGSQMGLDSCSCLHRKARGERMQVGVRFDLRAIYVQLSPPDQLLPAFIAPRWRPAKRRKTSTP
jgi:hypothetical protein